MQTQAVARMAFVGYMGLGEANAQLNYHKTRIESWFPAENTDVPHGGYHDTSVFEQLRYAARGMMVELYAGIILPSRPISKITPPKHARNAEIRARHRAGESLSALADVFGISEQRVHQIAQGRRK
jgi:hypothetical protein